MSTGGIPPTVYATKGTGLKETFQSIALMAVILGGAWWFTDWFTRKMYYRCRNCTTLNAKRRTHCRQCGHPVP
jgi:hypothetical protein